MAAGSAGAQAHSQKRTTGGIEAHIVLPETIWSYPPTAPLECYPDLISSYRLPGPCGVTLAGLGCDKNPAGVEPVVSRSKTSPKTC